MKQDLNRNFQRRAKRLYALFACLVLTLPVAVVPAFAADDPLSVVTSLSPLPAGEQTETAAGIGRKAMWFSRFPFRPSGSDGVYRCSGKNSRYSFLSACMQASRYAS